MENDNLHYKASMNIYFYACFIYSCTSINGIYSTTLCIHTLFLLYSKNHCICCPTL
ncbi:hypothetical protein BDF14DRAFT_1818356 [Spinellus fusiger]|nr:hypothetical protein BDF14DRAFT_1818356 [Spinellus fusiger]